MLNTPDGKPWKYLENIDDGELDWKVLTVLAKFNVNIDPTYFKACHWQNGNPETFQAKVFGWDS